MFLGQIIDQSGIRSDPNKVNAIQTMNEPTNTTEVQCFLGMANQLSKFIVKHHQASTQLVECKEFMDVVSCSTRSFSYNKTPTQFCPSFSILQPYCCVSRLLIQWTRCSNHAATARWHLASSSLLLTFTVNCWTTIYPLVHEPGTKILAIGTIFAE